MLLNAIEYGRHVREISPPVDFGDGSVGRGEEEASVAIRGCISVPDKKLVENFVSQLEIEGF